MRGYRRAAICQLLTSGRFHQVEKPKGFKCGTFGASSLEERHLATGDYGGRLDIWYVSLRVSLRVGASATHLTDGTRRGLWLCRDLERPEKAVYSVQAHKQIVNAIDGCGGLNIGGGAPEIVTCSRDGTVRVWDPRVTDPVLSMEPAEGEASRDCWTVAFGTTTYRGGHVLLWVGGGAHVDVRGAPGNSYNDSERCIAAGYDNGDVKLFDLRCVARHGLHGCGWMPRLT